MNFSTDFPPRFTSTPQPQELKKYDFPSKRVVPIDWHKLASVDFHELNRSSVEVKILQEHLNHIAFCRPETEIHIESASGQRNMLKMFRLAQLIIQYLFISQEYMENQLSQMKRENQSTLEKYNEAKERLKEQKEEARKIKNSNKNLTESVSYLNSLLSSIGALEHYRCPFCPKAFRSKDFLTSHLKRKHPLQSDAVNIASCFVTNKNIVNNSLPGHPNKHEDIQNASPYKFPQIPHLTVNLPQNSLNSNEQLKTAANDANLTPMAQYIEQASSSKTHSHSGFVMDANNSEVMNAFPSSLNTSGKESDSVLGKGINNYQFNAASNTGKSNDIDTYKLNEMQANFKSMNEMVLKLTKDLEIQKVRMELESEKRTNDLRQHVEEKQKLRDNYEETIKELHKKIDFIQHSKRQDFDTGKEKLLSLVERQQAEINSLKETLEKKASGNVMVKEETYNNELKTEIEKLRGDIKLAEKNHEGKISKLKREIQQEYETKLNKEIRKHSQELEGIKSMNLKSTPKQTNAKTIKTKRIVSKPISKQDKNRTEKQLISEKEEDTEPESETDTSKWYDENQPTLKNDLGGMAAGTDTSESSDEEQTEAENYSEVNPHPSEGKDNHKGSLRKVTAMYFNYDDSSNNSQKDYDEPVSDSDDSSLDLKKLVDKNPGLWNQMREVIAEDLTRRLHKFGISGTQKGITSRDLKSHILHLIRLRKPLLEKFKEFKTLRKKIENEVDNKLQRELSHKGKSRKNLSSNTQSKYTSKTFKDGIKNVASKLNYTTKNSKTCLNKNESETLENISDEDEEDNENSTADSSEPEENYNRKTALVDVHAETSHSVTRNLFSSSPLEGSPPNPQRQCLFENKTYNNVSDEWDSDSSYQSSSNHRNPYENVRTELSSKKFGDRKIESNLDEYSNAKIDEYKDIKLKKPTGQMVKELSQKIESQLKERTLKKPPGSIDVMGSDERKECPSDELQDIESISLSD